MRLLRCISVTAVLSAVALLFPGRAAAWCTLDLEKCVVVDEDGDGFDDDECVDAATAKVGDEVKWQYTVTNTSDWKWDLRNCVLNDPDVGFNDTIDVLYSPVTAAGPSSAVLETDAAYCEDIHNVATVTCDCYWAPTPVMDQVPESKSATDDATLTCETIPEPGFDLAKECKDQTEGADAVPGNDFSVTVVNTGNTDLECTIVGDGIDDVGIPTCEDSTYPCYLCRTTELSVPAGETEQTFCRVFGLEETAVDTVGVQCESEEGWTMAKRASDECYVPPPNPDWELTKDCKDQYIDQNGGIPTNLFNVTVENTGGVDLTCNIIGDGINDAAIPECPEVDTLVDGNDEEYPCYLCRTTDLSVKVGETKTTACVVRGLEETSNNTVGVDCTGPLDYEMAKRASDECFVPKKIPDFTVVKACFPQRPEIVDVAVADFDGRPMVNDFVVGVTNTGETPLDCSIIGDGIDGQAIPMCGVPTGLVDGDHVAPCWVCETTDFSLDAGKATRVACRLYGLEESAIDTVGVQCTGPDEWEKAKRASAECLVPELKVRKVCDPQKWPDGPDGETLAFDGEEPVNLVHIKVANTGDVDFTNCRIVEERILLRDGDGEPTLVPDGEGPRVVCKDEETGPLPAGEFAELKCAVFGLEETALNVVKVACGYPVDGESARIIGMSKDECEVERGCFTRTPGYWKTHPDIANIFFEGEDFGGEDGGLEICGEHFDNAYCSPLREMCLLPDGKIQLARQCTAAAINLAVTERFGGNCFATVPKFERIYERCCSSCPGVFPERSLDDGEVNCIESLDFFNNFDFGGIDDESLCPNRELGTDKPCGADPGWCDEEDGDLGPREFRSLPELRVPDLHPDLERLKPNLRLQERPELQR